VFDVVTVVIWVRWQVDAWAAVLWLEKKGRLSASLVSSCILKTLSLSTHSHVLKTTCEKNNKSMTGSTGVQTKLCVSSLVLPWGRRAPNEIAVTLLPLA